MPRTTDNPAHIPTALRHRLRGAPARVAVEQTGQALVEFVLILPLLLLGAYLIVHFGLAQNSFHDQQHIADVVARYATVNQNPGEEESPPKSLQAWAKKQADNKNVEDGKICITYPKGATAGEPVTVEFTSSMSWVPNASASSVIGALTGVANYKIKATATERLATAPSKIAAGCA